MSYQAVVSSGIEERLCTRSGDAFSKDIIRLKKNFFFFFESTPVKNFE